MELSTYAFTAGQERRTISYGYLDDSSACVRQVSTGDLTEFVFDCVERTVTVSFLECEVYYLLLRAEGGRGRTVAQLHEFEQHRPSG